MDASENKLQEQL